MMKGGLFRKKKSESSDSTPESLKVSPGSRLLELCNGDTELYQSLARILIVDPKRVTVPIDSFLAEAQEDEAKGDKLRAELAYRIAGALALFKGDKEGVQKYFQKALSLATTSRQEYKTLAQHPANAVEVARRYYESESIQVG